MRAVSLFSGCLGLDLGLEALGIEAACYVENDRDCLRLIGARRPDALVVEDVRAVDAELEESLGAVELVAGGFPCQDLSYAGRGAGLDGDRSGLWFEMIRVVRDLRPRLVLVENVPGLLTRGLHVVIHDLARAGYVGRWFTLGAVDVGAPHRRERVFILARRADVSRTESLEGGHPTGLFQADGWFSPQESLFDTTPVLRLGKRGRWTLDAVYEDDTRLAIDDDADLTLLPTPNSSESTPTDDFLDEIRDADLQPDARLYLPGRKHHVQRTLSRIVPLVDHVGGPLLPTPGAHDATGAEDETRKARQETGSTGGPSLRDLPKLLPTPCHADWRGRSGPNADSPESRLANVEALLPTPAARDGKGGNPNERDGGPDLPSAIDALPADAKLLPTPVVTDSFGSRRSTARTDEWESNAGTTLTDAIWETQGREEDTRGKLLPTPSAALADGGQKTRGGDRQDELLLGGIAEAASAGSLLPTPVANPDNPGAGGELRAALTHGPGRRNETGIDSLGRPNAGRPSRLLPTPQKSDGDGGRLDRNPETLATGRRPSGSKVSVPLATAIDTEVSLFDAPAATTPSATGAGDGEALIPTPKVTASRKSRKAMVENQQWSAPDIEQALEIARGELPREFESWEEVPGWMGRIRPEEKRADGTSWGVYAAAIERWEAITGRTAPTPTDEKGRLAPEFVEWMLGFPLEWSSLDGAMARTARLRMLGNSVQVQVGQRVGSLLLALDRDLSTGACA